MGQVAAETDASAYHLRSGPGPPSSQFRGEILQVPPMYSALKRDGKRLYELARKGIEVEREPRPVSVYGIELTGWEPPIATVKVDCGRGFYMRSLAHDVGQMLGCGGHLKSLVRIKTGPFHLDEAVTLEEAEIGFEDGSWTDLVHTVPTSPWGGYGRSSPEAGRGLPSRTGDPCPRRSHFSRLSLTSVAACTAPTANSWP